MTNPIESYASDPGATASDRPDNAVSQSALRERRFEGVFITFICLLILLLSSFGFMYIYAFER